MNQNEEESALPGVAFRVFSKSLAVLPIWRYTVPRRTLTPFTESQNHRIVGVGRDLCGSSSPTPPPKQGHLQ